MKRLFAIILLSALATGISANAVAAVVDFSGLTTPTDITLPNAYTINGVTLSYDDLGSGVDFASIDQNGVSGTTPGTLIFTFDTPQTALSLDFKLLGVTTGPSNTIDGLVIETYSAGTFVDTCSVTATFTAYNAGNPALGDSAGSLAYTGASFDQVLLYFSLDAPNFTAANINYFDPNSVPAAPTIGVATASNAQATVNFTPPAFDGGITITSYTVTSNDGISASGTINPITVTGLTNGTAYTFTVTATNANGTGPASAPSNSVTPAAIVPGAPTIGTATAGNAQASVSFTAPATDGGSPITSYTVTSSPGSKTGSGTASPITVTGLTNGTAYSFTVTATNAVGTSSASRASNSVTPVSPLTAPGAPTSATATAGNAQAAVSFTAPASNGGSAITSYTVTSNPGSKTGSGAASPITVTGLTNGTAYTFTVTATNANGTGPASASSNSVTPATVPGAPTIGTAVTGNAQATASFTAPASNGGSAITSYTVTSNPGSKTGSGTASPITVTGLTNGTAYTFTVTATNAVGTGPASAASNSVTPTNVGPAAPSKLKAAKSALSANSPTVTLTWIDNSGNEDGFTIQRATDSKFTVGLTTSTVGANIATLTDSDVLPKTKYYYRVIASNAIGNSKSSKTVKVTTVGQLPAALTNLAAGTVTSTSAVMTWTDNATNETGFKIQWSKNASFKSASTTTVKTANLTTSTITKLRTGTTYYCRVAAYNKSGTGAWSNAITITTP
jgi:trimeric autotransporter adhesin